MNDRRQARSFARLAGRLAIVAAALAPAASLGQTAPPAVTPPAVAPTAPAATTPPPTTTPTPTGAAAPRRFISLHKAVIGGRPVRYRATVEEHFVADPAGRRAASIFTTSYVRTDVANGRTRPVIFAFNGGPGSASLWLHLGYLSPRRIDFGDMLKPETVPPFRLVDNGESPLDVADIVLIDPPGTGFSRVLPDAKPEQFYGTQGDALTTVDIIRQWVRANDRWNAPKYLLSESYGTVRAAVVAKLLAGGPTGTGDFETMTLNGVMLLGQALAMTGAPGDTQYLTALPTLAASACYHRKVAAGCTAEDQVAKARAFAANDYQRALWQGSTLPAAEREAIAERLSALIGLPTATILAQNLRVSTASFARGLLDADGRQIGAYDARYTLPLAAAGDPVADDPAMGQYGPGFVAVANDYLRNDLGANLDISYQPIAFRAVNARWDYGAGPGVFSTFDFSGDLATAMRRNPAMRLMVGAGYYDLVTTLGAAEYTISHGGIPLDRTRFHYYASGHMSYLGGDALIQTARDVRAFVTAPR